jgi:hypothetical protein
MTKLNYALTLASLGLAVFPCAANDKSPITGPGGFRHASRDEGVIREWWRRTPEANIGLYPDACRPRLLILDFDCKAGARGLETARRLLAEGVLHPDDTTIRTPSGGLHVYLRIRDGERYGNARVWADTDIRQAGGYVLTVGSEIDGIPYAPAGRLADALEVTDAAA